MRSHQLQPACRMSAIEFLISGQTGTIVICTSLLKCGLIFFTSWDYQPEPASFCSAIVNLRLNNLAAICFDVTVRLAINLFAGLAVSKWT